MRRAGWTRVGHGLYRPSTSGPASDLEADLHAWRLTLPQSAAFTHLTAAIHHGWWTPPLPADLPVFAQMPAYGNRPRRDGLVVCRHTQPVGSLVRGGLRLSSPAETLLAAARDLGLLDLVVLADAALHSGDCDIAGLRTVAGRRRRGAPALRRALRFVDARSESAWESVARLLHQVCSVPVEPQHEVRDADDSLVARGDLWIVGTRRLHEYDGEVHRDPRQHARDLLRERALQRIGWQRYGYTSSVLLHQATSVLRDADVALGRAHRPERVRAWHELLAESLFTPAGTARLRRSWGLADGSAPETGQRRQT